LRGGGLAALWPGNPRCKMTPVQALQAAPDAVAAPGSRC
jgi:hypothetical protein